MSMATWVRVGACLGFLGVALGAFGAHGLKGRLDALGQAANYQTATLYHLVHALALVAVGLAGAAAGGKPGWLNLAGWLFLGGILIFSGSLYILSLTGLRWLGAITPIGGLALLAGWLALAAGAGAGSSGRP